MFSGSMVAIVTPMTESGEVDFPALARLCEWHIASGTDAIVAVGTTGESATLTPEEHRGVIRQVVQTVVGRIPVIAGSAAPGTQATIELTREAMSLGVDACLLLSPPYIKPTQEGLYQHYKAIASAVPIPQIVYNVPARTSSDILPETLERLADIPNIVGVKEATGSVVRSQKIRDLCGHRLDIYSGEDAATLDLMLEAGAKGVISVAANIVPDRMHDICHAALNQDKLQAKVLNDKLAPLYKGLFLESNPIPAKWALHKMGLIDAGIRLPLTSFDETHHSFLSEAMFQLGVLKEVA